MRDFFQQYRIQSLRLIVSFAMFIVIGSVLIISPDSLDYPASAVLLRLAEIVNALLLAVLFYAAIGLIIGRIIAWRVAIVILITSIVWSYVQSLTLFNVPAIISFVALLIIIPTRQFYTRQSEKKVILAAIRSSLLVVVLLTLTGILVDWLFDISQSYHSDFLTTIVTSLDHMYVLPRFFHSFHYTPNLERIIVNSILFVLGVICYTIVALALLKPLIDQFILTPAVHQKVLRLLKQYGIASDDFFKYFPNDKSYFFDSHVDGFIAYRVSGRMCIALADPIAKDEADRRRLIERFLDYTEKRGWLVSFLPVDETRLPLYSAHEFRRIKLGAHAVVDLKAFAATTAKNKHFRYIQNKFTKQGYKARLHSPPHTTVLLSQLRTISDEWLQKGNRKERQFTMGYFDEAYMQHSHLFIVYDVQKQPQAFVSLPPSFSSHGISFDLLRYRLKAPKDINAFLFLKLFLQLHTEKYKQFDMGLAPLSGLEASQQLDERSLHILYRYASRWFAFKGLYAFKSRFKPTWKSYYAIHQGHSMHTLSFAIELNRLMKYNQANKDKRSS